MYQMTLYFKKVIYKKYYLMNTQQNISNCAIFSNFLGEHAPKLPGKGHGFTIMWLCAAYCFDTSKFSFQKKILTPIKFCILS